MARSFTLSKDLRFAKCAIASLLVTAIAILAAGDKARAAKEIGNRCRVVSDAIPFSQRNRGEFFRASAVFTKRLLMKRGEKALVLGTLRSTAPSTDKSIDKMLLGALLASFEAMPKAYLGRKTGEETYEISVHGELSERWLQISPALAYNVARETNKYGLINLHALYEAKWSGEHWITILSYAATTRDIARESIPISAHQRACDLIAIKLD